MADVPGWRTCRGGGRAGRAGVADVLDVPGWRTCWTCRGGGRAGRAGGAGRAGVADVLDVPGVLGVAVNWHFFLPDIVF